VTALLPIGALAGSGFVAALSVFFPGLGPLLLWVTYGLATFHSLAGSARLAFFGALVLLWVVQREPAPSDLCLIAAIGWALISGRVRVRRDFQHLSLLAFQAINLIQVTLAEEWWRAIFFAGVSAYWPWLWELRSLGAYGQDLARRRDLG
jgi:hypothetical protein